MENIINTPILIIAFNRPEISKETFAFLGYSKPLKIYLAVDGPRPDRPGEDKLVNQVKDVYSNPAWDCKIMKKFNSTNMGAEKTVSNAVSWVLSYEESVIVLEDDILAPYSFLNFAQEMLQKYKNTDNVYQICGAQFTPYDILETDYVFSFYGHTGCGWATFRRAWEKFDLNIDDFDQYLNNNDLKKQFATRGQINRAIRFVKRMKLVGKGNSNWDKCWSYCRLKNKGLSIVPRVNLTRNIGIFGLHGDGLKDFQKIEFDNEFVAKKHPKDIAVNKEYDLFHYQKYLYIPFLKKVYLKIHSIIKKMKK